MNNPSWRCPCRGEGLRPKRLPVIQLPAILALVFASMALAQPGAMAASEAHMASPPPEGSYMLRQLAQLTDRNWARVAGGDTGLPSEVNGHDQFVAAWTREILRDLHGLPVGVFRQSFTPSGFLGDAPKKPAMNVLAIVPGTRYPDQAVVIGAHPDGEPWSRGSAFDDASGCVIMLGLARALGGMWRLHGLPTRTVEFVLFDAEEQGLDGSIAYSFDLRHGAILPRPVFTIDEEQSGIGYPARPFGLLGADLMPSFAATTPAQPARGMGPHLSAHILRAIGSFTLPPISALRTAKTRILVARTAAFAGLRQTYPRISYRGGSAPAFTSSDERLVRVSSKLAGGSDNEPFEALGLPTVTFAGDSAYYLRDAPDWAYPYDQPEDTFAAMACDTGGSPQAGTALAAALDLEVAMSYSLVQVYAPPAARGRPLGLAILSTTAGVGKPVHFDAVGASRGALSGLWSFGDGRRARGSAVDHTFRQAGQYTVTVKDGAMAAVRRITVAKRQPLYVSELRGLLPPRKPWNPPELQGIPGCSEASASADILE